MQFDNATNLDRKPGYLGNDDWFPMLFLKGATALTVRNNGGLRRLLSVPRTLRRTWGTPIVPLVTQLA
jgi:hypothetical protein